MGESPRQSWVLTAVFLGIGYALVGIVFAVPATHVQAWRLAAWVVSAIDANIHSLSAGSTSQHRQLLLLSLGIWPVITALPAFLVALGTNMVLARALGSVQGR